MLTIWNLRFLHKQTNTFSSLLLNKLNLSKLKLKFVLSFTENFYFIIFILKNEKQKVNIEQLIVRICFVK
jgi:hypothetical protein